MWLLTLMRKSGSLLLKREVWDTCCHDSVLSQSMTRSHDREPKRKLDSRCCHIPEQRPHAVPTAFALAVALACRLDQIPCLVAGQRLAYCQVPRHSPLPGLLYSAQQVATPNLHQECDPGHIATKSGQSCFAGLALPTNHETCCCQAEEAMH